MTFPDLQTGNGTYPKPSIFNLILFNLPELHFMVRFTSKLARISLKPISARTSPAMALPQTKIVAPVVDINPPKIGVDGYQGLNPRTETLPKGWNGFQSRPLPCDIFVEHDVTLQMRDGAKLYADIYRPPSSREKDLSEQTGTAVEKVQALICWSPFGKKFNGLMSLKLMTPWNLGIPDKTLSGLEKFEAPDPADWVSRGYAIVNVDSRGSGDSDGVMCIMGSQEAEDGYDCIEAIAKLPWCTGSVGLAGNSHLAIAQWAIAALRPPSLKAIAPWEGCGDIFREQFVRGGIYAGDLFDNLIVKYMLKGRHGMESFKEMHKKHPLANAWWNDKRPDMKKINLPAYITGTWTNTMHGMGAIRAWMEIDTAEKWLRWHPWQEWYDLWGRQESKDELMLFFDRYLKGIDNGWEKTPHVRMSILRFGTKDPIENVVEHEFPMARTDYKKLYFSSENTLKFEPQSSAHVASYNSESDDSASYTYKFDKTTQIVGMPKAVLYMACEDMDDMDVYVFIEKLDKDGKPMKNLNIPWSGIPVKSFEEFKPEQETEVVLYKGPVGILRASHREIDPSKSMHPNWPYHPHEREEKVPPGQIVRLDIGIWAMGIEYEEGESLRVHVSGRSFAVNNFGTFDHVNNKGRHKIFLSEEHPSHIILPFTSS
ncbi:X-Pro dipeptidyl-peptidase C-terminal non-catalytic domain-containing protein [Rutstroemia sp. NJR-2017a WRK4]|nr:X-Pro dipeptidyl-peptidase C-terminal non-catalytic domain-containing protein [Rutstroemia sp. NJR-2017a WRK4]PQE11729.1 X-Pro dipeptidyl-peptidase C-terminal non-catalytic domain-containing protein [Rutstroemia sp. NJR-2017a WRK4]